MILPNVSGPFSKNIMTYKLAVLLVATIWVRREFFDRPASLWHCLQGGAKGSYTKQTFFLTGKLRLVGGGSKSRDTVDLARCLNQVR